MSKGYWNRKPKTAEQLAASALKKAENFRFAVIDPAHKEVLCANFYSPGAAWNAKILDYVGPDRLIVVKTKDDVVLGEVDRFGVFRKKGTPLNLLPKTIWENQCRRAK